MLAWIISQVKQAGGYSGGAFDFRYIPAGHDSRIP